MDELQVFRMTVVWPLVVGCAGFLAARALLWIVAPKPRRSHAAACAVAGVAGVLLGVVIGDAWDNGSAYWMAFTVGLSVLAGILLLTVALSFVGMWYGR